ncbi:hypothetical protein LTR27_001307 [Elasticomyces elasticus]|nr:hypothetical protein LTR27_001307 [Elasticomyces elasticus]
MADDTPPAKRVKLDFSQHVRVLVGPKKQEFVVHKDVIIPRSGFFKAAVSSRWSAGGDGKSVKLGDEDPLVFAKYLECLYTSTVHMDDAVSDQREAIELYVLADKLGDLKSANIIIDRIMAWIDQTEIIPGVSCVAYALANSTEKSQLRRLLVDYYVHECDGKAFEEATQSPELCIEIVREYARLKICSWDATVDNVFNEECSKRQRCYYHQHDETCPPCAAS